MAIPATTLEQHDSSFSNSTYMSGGSADTSFEVDETLSQISMDSADSSRSWWDMEERIKRISSFQNGETIAKLKIKEINGDLDWAFQCLVIRIGILERHNPNSQQQVTLKRDKTICLVGLEATEELQRSKILDPRVYRTENQFEQDLTRLEKVANLLDKLVKGFGIVQSRVLQIQNRIFPVA